MSEKKRPKSPPGMDLRIDPKNFPNEEKLREIQALATLGYSKNDIAEAIGIDRHMMDRMLAIPESRVREAVSKGRELNRRRSYRCFVEQAFPMEKIWDEESQEYTVRPSCKGDPSLMIFYMKTRYRWKSPDKKLTVKAEGNVPPVINFNLRQEVPDAFVPSDADEAKQEGCTVGKPERTRR